MPATIRCKHVTPLLIAVLTTLALAVGVAAPADATGRRGHRIHHAVAVAVHQKGDRYRYGADGPRRFDCSGLVQFSFARAGLLVPRTSREQAQDARRIKRRKMRPGDLMFFHTRRGRVYHVAIYTGWTRHHQRRMVHAPSPGQRVRTSVPWTTRWFAGTLRRRR
jgi:cell wall-associated NlpC family hydrolase